MPRLLSTGIALGALVLLALGGCRGGGAPAAPPPAEPVVQQNPLAPLASSARLYYDNSGGIADSVRLVVRDDEGWAELWSRATSRQSSPPGRPAIDFENEMVVAVGAGRMTPLDRIQVDSAGFFQERTVDGVEEEYFLIVVRTIEGCRRLDADAFPLEIVKVPRFEGSVRWGERRERAPDCGDLPE